MGADGSRLGSGRDGERRALKAPTVAALADYLTQNGAAKKKIVVLTGAGISTSAGIPDFRSEGTGLYANLQRLELPRPEAVFDISFFRHNPQPFYSLAKELYPGKFRPTLAHSFIRLLHDKGLLLLHATQNIDCLDREAGVPGDKIVEAHGSFARQSCIECKTSFPKDEMLKAVEAETVPRCRRPGCGGLVKPEIVFFGEALPREFFASAGLVREADCVIVMGTSLTVFPFAGLPQAASLDAPRVLINLERVGGLGDRPDDVLLLGDCDAGVRRLARACGWEEELDTLWRATGAKFGVASSQDSPPEESKQTREQRDAALTDEVDKLTADVERTLQLSKDHGEREAERDKQTVAKQVEQDVQGPVEEETGLSHVFPHIKKGSSSL